MLYLKLEMDNKRVSDMLKKIDELDKEMEPEEYIFSLIDKDLYLSKFKELEDKELNSVIEKMISFAMESTKPDRTFKANELYVKTFDEQWTKLAPSTRKALGRRFRSATDALWDKAEDGITVIEFVEKNINNAAIYKVVKKKSL